LPIFGSEFSKGKYATMRTCNDIRQTFLDFFKSKQHEIVASAPMVVKGDPTLMFNNSGMAPFKDIFLGNSPIKFPRVADTQKCLRVSGKHNDLEEVGVDTYHHTMFEMLGNWSFGDYFKKEAIAWAWELLTEVYKIDKSRLYVTVFEGSAPENVPFDQEAYDTWKQFISEDRIIHGNKKDNFWEMGDTGPCGPCSEIHVDIRSEEERKKIDGKSLVNVGHPHVIEIWNNVFMEFNRKADKSLEKLPKQHVDTGMGFERLCMVLQDVQSNYDTDVFQPIIKTIEHISSKKYDSSKEDDATQLKINIAIRVIADHIRTISFSIADGQLPSNTGAGYVIRRILRRAVRYGYQSLDLKEAFLYQLAKPLAAHMGEAFPELKQQLSLIERVIKEEEVSFYRTLDTGIKRIEQLVSETKNKKTDIINGQSAFELFDTFGFPIDLTSLIARENGLSIDEKAFEAALIEQKNRSRAATNLETGDWINFDQAFKSTEFVGYEKTETNVRITKYRLVNTKGKQQYQLMLDKTPFYAESGGQVGDKGTLSNANDIIRVIDTRKEAGAILHITEQLPENLNATFFAEIDKKKRSLTENNHSATHLMHAALRKILGTHVEQKGSLVNEFYLRFDFSHFSKVTDYEIEQIEEMVNEKIRENIITVIESLPIEEAKKKGAMALFGEKYGDVVRVVSMDSNYSIELCGGTHVKATGQIGLFKIISESAVASGIRRIEAYTSVGAEQFLKDQLSALDQVKTLLKNPKDVLKSIEQLQSDNALMQKQIAALYKDKAKGLKQSLLSQVESIHDLEVIAQKVDLESVDAIKDLVFELKDEQAGRAVCLAAVINQKPMIFIGLNEALNKQDTKYHAGNLVKALAKHIKGGGGGAPHFANAGGTDNAGISLVLNEFKTML
jgi:alanyl-tRNA synthetase